MPGQLEPRAVDSRAVIVNAKAPGAVPRGFLNRPRRSGGASAKDAYEDFLRRRIAAIATRPTPNTARPVGSGTTKGSDANEIVAAPRGPSLASLMMSLRAPVPSDSSRMTALVVPSTHPPPGEKNHFATGSNSGSFSFIAGRTQTSRPAESLNSVQNPGANASGSLPARSGSQPPGPAANRMPSLVSPPN